jgi:hypothetical protein
MIGEETEHLLAIGRDDVIAHVHVFVRRQEVKHHMQPLSRMFHHLSQIHDVQLGIGTLL